MSARPNTQHATPRARAQAIEPELAALCARLCALPDDHPHRIHALFAELYLCTTRCWLAGLSARQDSDYAYRVMCHFFALYRTHVLARLGQPLETCGPHWRSYHRMARRQTLRSPISSHLALISVGARAHVHLDLGLAMLLAEAEMRAEGIGAAASLATQRQIFGQLADAAFYRAAHDYVALHHGRQTGWRRFVLTLDRVGLSVLKPVWLRVLQHWRRTGYVSAVGGKGAAASRTP